MDVTEQRRFDELYQRHLRMLKLQGLSDKTIDVYARAVRRIAKHFDCCPDRLTLEQLEVYFGLLVDSHSWSTVKVDRNGLQFFWRYVLKLDWQWVKIIKPPTIRQATSHMDRGGAQKTMKLLVADCGIKKEWRPLSCGHRSCPQCQNHEASQWLDRQQAKLLPVSYFMVTFTLPYELRSLAWHFQLVAVGLAHKKRHRVAPTQTEEDRQFL